MTKQICKKCGQELFIKKILEEGYEYFCYDCEKLVPLDKEKSIKLCNDYLKIIRNNTTEYAKKFSRNSLLYASLNIREMAFKKDPDLIQMKIKEIIWASMIIKDCLEGNYAEGKEKFSNDDLGKLFYYYNEKVATENLITEINENYFILFAESENLKKLFAEIKPNLKLDINYYAFPRFNWKYFLEALETMQIVPELRIKKAKKIVDDKVNKHSREISLLKLKLNSKGRPGLMKKIQSELAKKEEDFKIQTLEIFYNSFYGLYYNDEFFSFKELKKENKISRFIAQLSKIANSQIELNKEEAPQKRLYYEMNLDKFKELCLNEEVDFDEMYAMFVSSEGDIKSFPIVVESESKLLICPETLFLIWSFVNYDINKQEYKSKIGSLGDNFEGDTRAIFESKGFSLNDPKHKGQLFFRRKFKIINKEIDLIPYTETSVFIIDCKRNALRPRYIYDYERKNRAFGNDGIKDEIENKHLIRIQFVKDNLKNLGLNPSANVKGLIVTFIKEDIEDYKNVDIVSFNDLEDYLEN